MRRAVLAVIVVVLIALVASQLLLPSYLEGKAEDRLTARGGRASVSLEALPALRLLFEDGDKLQLEGRGLRVEPRDRESFRFQHLFDKLDGFDEVDMRVVDFSVGPVAVRSFALSRPEDRETYRFRTSATTSARDLYRYVASRVSGPLGPLVFGAAESLLRPARRPIPIELAGELASDDGRPRLVSGTGEVAGIRTGLLVELLVAALTAQL